MTDLIKAWRKARIGDIIEFLASDASVEREVRAWAKRTENKLIGVVLEKGGRKVIVRMTKKGKENAELSAQRGNMADPDETRVTPKAKMQLLTIGGFTLGLRTMEPGWRWSTAMKPIAGTTTCKVRHLGYMLSGRLGFIMDDGSKLEAMHGDFFDVRPGHEAWTIGEVPAVYLELIGAVESLKPWPEDKAA